MAIDEWQMQPQQVYAGNTGSAPQGSTIITSDTNVGWTYYPAPEPLPELNYQQWIPTPDYMGGVNSKNIGRLKEEIKKLKEANKMAQMGLYEIFVVDTKNRKYMKNFLIAKDESAAKLKQAQGLQRWLDENKVNEDFIEYFVREVGAWEDKKPKEVKIVKE